MADSTVDYDGAEMDVGPRSMDGTAKRLQSIAQGIADALARIQTTLDGLVLDGWQGKSQQEATNLNTRWMMAMTHLFGTTDKPGDGVLNAIADGVEGAAQNYGTAESGLTDLWNSWSGKFSDTGGDGDKNQTPPDELDTNATAITADY